MAKGLAIAFLIAFVGGHLADREGDAFDRPLSLFRDVEPAWIGYAMFVLLIALAAEMGRTAWRLRYRSQVAVYVFVACSLTVAALTPSFAPLHILSANVSILALFLNYACLLERNNQHLWLAVHLTIPLLLVLADLFGTTGMWEKGQDLYFVAAVVIHHHVMEKSLVFEDNVRPLVESGPTSTV